MTYRMKSSMRDRQRVRLGVCYGNFCFYCEKSFDDAPLDATLDHVITRSRGGNNFISNLVLACHYCNNLRSDDLFEDFVRDFSLGLFGRKLDRLRKRVAVFEGYQAALNTRYRSTLNDTDDYMTLLFFTL